MPRIRHISPHWWVSGAYWTDARVQLSFQDVRTGAPGTGTFDSLLPYIQLAGPGVLKRNVELRLDKLERTDPRLYAQALGQPGLDTSGQAVYCTEVGKAKVLLPAQLLILSVLGATNSLRAVLLSPGGPELLVRPYLDDGELQLRTDAQGRKESARFILAERRLLWILTHPSARAAWASVFRYAAEGKVDLRLPAGKIHTALRGHVMGNTFAVTNLLVWSVEPTEEPFEFAKGRVPLSFLLNAKKLRRGTHVEPPAPVQEPELAGLRCAERGLTDAEWSQLKPALDCVRRPRTGKYTRRAMFDAILKKYGRPCTWGEAVASELEYRAAVTYLKRLRRGGCWESLLKVIDSFERT